MSDRELLEAAAKAARIPAFWDDLSGSMRVVNEGAGNWYLWRPLADDGDALRLAVRLNLLVFTARSCAVANASDRGGPCIREVFHDDKNDLSATRRAIVRAAAEIGKAMP